MLARLDVATADYHPGHDRRWRRFLDRRVTRDDYASMLGRTYGLEAPFEAACSYTPGVSAIVELRGRWRSGLLAQDLLALGSTPARITSLKCAVITPFQHALEALGWLYVIERPTLLFADVRAKLVGHHVDLDRATTYLRAFEHVANRRRAELGIAMDRAASDKAADRLFAAARDAFAFARRWYDGDHHELHVVHDATA